MVVVMVDGCWCVCSGVLLCGIVCYCMIVFQVYCVVVVWLSSNYSSIHGVIKWELTLSEYECRREGRRLGWREAGARAEREKGWPSNGEPRQYNNIYLSRLHSL